MFAFAKLRTALSRYGFYQSHVDNTIFTFRKGDDILFMLVYVDDNLVASNNATLCASFRICLDRCFRLKDLGLLKYFLGIKFTRSLEGLFIFLQKYTLHIIHETGLLDAVTTPLPQNHRLTSSTSPLHTDASFVV